jgi:hypothetical protein
VVGAVPGRGPAWAQVDRERLSGAVLAMVEERTHRVKAVAALVGRLGAFLVRVRGHQRRVDVHDHLPTVPAPRGAGQRPTLGPHRGPGIGTCLADCGDRSIDIAGKGSEQPRDSRIGGHIAEHRWLGAYRRDIGQAVTAERDRGRHIEQHLARIMLSTIRPPRRQRHRQTTVQAGRTDRLQQQQRSRGRDQRLADRIENDIRDRDTLHLRSAFHLSLLNRRKSKNPKQDRHFRALRAVPTPAT